MARRENMLEDMLRALAHNEQRESETRAKALDDPAGPYGLSEKRAAPQKPAARAETSQAGGMRSLLSERQRFIALQGLLAVAFFFLGRASVGIVRAEKDPGPEKTAALPSTPPAGAGREGCGCGC